MTAYALAELERGSDSFSATLSWAQLPLVAGVITGIGTILSRRL
ncbi:hypothetical protein [Microbacterium suwonense]|nr:hypothetical protein [Microbacterium suwonense]